MTVRSPICGTAGWCDGVDYNPNGSATNTTITLLGPKDMVGLNEWCERSPPTKSQTDTLSPASKPHPAVAW